MSLLKNDFEGQTNGASATNTNSANSGVALAFNRTGGSTTTYSSAHPAHGSMGLLMASAAASPCSCTVNLSAATNKAASHRYLYTDALPSATTQIMQINGVVVYLNSNGTIELHDKAGTTIWTSTAVLAINTLYRLEQSLQTGTGTGDGQVNFAVYVGDSATAISGGSFSSTAMNAGTGTFTQTVYGRSSAGSAGAWNDWIDDISGVDGTTTFIGPPASPPTAAFSYSKSALTLSVDGTASTAVSPATLSSYDWDWGDASAHGSGSTASHTYAAAGSYTVVLKVTDSAGQTNSLSQTVAVAPPAGTVTAQSVDVSTGWTPTSGTALACITDGDASSFVSSASPPTAQEFDVTLQALTAPAAGQPFKVFLTIDATLAASASLAAQLFEGATQRSALTGVAIPAGSGSSVSGVVTLTFPWADVQNVTTGGWNALKLKLQVTAS